ncbi:MAG: hypothetical protein LC792_22080 [Actinobacteria bacterium]|nr:hypothetical protein [Actinomycetota bacterium]
MTLILMVATFGVLTVLGVSCRRARLDLEEQLCECLHTPVAAAVGYGAGTVEIVAGPPVLTGIDGGRQVAATAGHGRRRHLRVVEAG